MPTPTGHHRPGSPFPHGTSQPELVVAEHMDGEEGVRVTLLGDAIVWEAHIDGTSITFGIDICQVLEAIQDFTRRYGS